MLKSTLAPYISNGQVQFVWRNMAFIGQESTWAAEAGDCAADQGQFWAYHDALFAHQGNENSGAFSKANLSQIAKDLGLDQNQFDSCLGADTYGPSVAAETNEAKNEGLKQAPTVLVNDQVLPVDLTASVIKTAVNKALGQ